MNKKSFKKELEDMLEYTFKSLKKEENSNNKDFIDLVNLKLKEDDKKKV